MRQVLPLYILTVVFIIYFSRWFSFCFNLFIGHTPMDVYVHPSIHILLFNIIGKCVRLLQFIFSIFLVVNIDQRGVSRCYTKFSISLNSRENMACCDTTKTIKRRPTPQHTGKKSTSSYVHKVKGPNTPSSRWGCAAVFNVIWQNESSSSAESWWGNHSCTHIIEWYFSFLVLGTAENLKSLNFRQYWL